MFEPRIPRSAIDYLNRRREILEKLFPKAFQQNDGPPVCIPPSWDLIRGYAGPKNEHADGYSAFIYKEKERGIVGENGEEAVLHLFQKLSIGGILVGNIDSKHMLINETYDTGRGQLLPEELKNIVREVRDGVPGHCKRKRFQLDFVFMHPILGICQFEAKKSSGAKWHNKGSGIQQLNNGILKQLFVKFCYRLHVDLNGAVVTEAMCEEIWGDLCGQGAVIHFDMNGDVEFVDANGESFGKTREASLNSNENVIKFTQYFDDRLKTTTQRNCFNSRIFQEFAIFLCAFRPNFFISPAFCAMKTRENLRCNRIAPLNVHESNDPKTVRLQVLQVVRECHKEYKLELANNSTKHFSCEEFISRILTKLKLQDKAAEFESVISSFSTSRENQNEFSDGDQQQFVSLLARSKLAKFNALNVDSIGAREFAEQLRNRGIITHSDIVFSYDSKEFHFTQQQRDAMRLYNDEGDMTVKRRIVSGPHGSGKSLVLLMHLFILGQVRLNRTLVCISSEKHLEKLEQFYAANAGRFLPGKKVRFLTIPEKSHNRPSLGRETMDVILDEQSLVTMEHAMRYVDHDSVVVAVINRAVYPWHNEDEVKVVEFAKHNCFQKMQLNAVFRCTNNIQNFIRALRDEYSIKQSLSGHSFDGVPVEEYDFGNMDALRTALRSILARLLDVAIVGDGIKADDIAVIHDMSYVAEVADLVDFGERTDGIRRYAAADVASLEFPIVIAILCRVDETNDRSNRINYRLPFFASRSVCHLIVFWCNFNFLPRELERFSPIISPVLEAGHALEIKMRPFLRSVLNSLSSL